MHTTTSLPLRRPRINTTTSLQRPLAPGHLSKPAFAPLEARGALQSQHAGSLRVASFRRAPQPPPVPLEVLLRLGR